MQSCDCSADLVEDSCWPRYSAAVSAFGDAIVYVVMPRTDYL